MRDDLEAAEITAIQVGHAVARDLIWVTAKDRDTSLPVTLGIWSGAGTQTFQVKDGVTGSVVARSFYGEGELLGIGAIPLTADLTVRSVDITLSQIALVVQTLVREYDVRNAPIQIYRGYFDLANQALVAPAKTRFIGYIDGAPIETPAEGGEGSCVIRCVSVTRELTRTNPDVRSHDSQIVRAAGDFFYKDTAVVGDWEIRWGIKNGKVGEKKKPS